MYDPRLMLTLNGADAQTSTSDAAERHGTITFNGSAELDTAEKVFGLSSLLLDGVDSSLSIANSDDWAIVEDSDKNWTIELRVKHADHAGTEVYISQYEDSNNYWMLYHVHGSGIRFIVVSEGLTEVDTTFAGEITDTSWHHVVLTKVDGVWGVYLDETQIGFSSATAEDTFAGLLYIGSLATSYYFNGNIDNVRIDKADMFGASPVVGLTDIIDSPTAEYESYELLPTFPYYPNLSRAENVTPFGFSPTRDSIKRSSYADGYPLAERRFTFQSYDIEFVISRMTDDDVLLLRDFYDDNGDREIAVYNTEDELFYHVMFTGEPVFEIDQDKGFWRGDFSFRQVSSDTWSSENQKLLLEGGGGLLLEEDSGSILLE